MNFHVDETGALASMPQWAASQAERKCIMLYGKSDLYSRITTRVIGELERGVPPEKACVTSL
jgi:hypothetical protein